MDEDGVRRPLVGHAAVRGPVALDERSNLRARGARHQYERRQHHNSKRERQYEQRRRRGLCHTRWSQNASHGRRHGKQLHNHSDTLAALVCQRLSNSVEVGQAEWGVGFLWHDGRLLGYKAPCPFFRPHCLRSYTGRALVAPKRVGDVFRLSYRLRQFYMYVS